MQLARSCKTSLKQVTASAPWWRALVLGILLALSLACSAWLISRSPVKALPIDVNVYTLIASVFLPYSMSFLPYMLACVLVFTTRPASGRWRWLELGLILGGAALLRALLVPLPPNLSRDSWLYVWDARVFVHGYSPYVYAPGNKILMPLWNFVFQNSRYRNVPALYPPGAQYVYALSYLLAPDNLYALKGIFVLFDLASCVVLAKLCLRKGLDPARVILYAWCPLTIVEFALQGHVDALPITFTLLAALTASDRSWHGRGLTGFLIGMGTLTRLYPLLMLVPAVSLRKWKRDWLLVLSCLLTIVAGYIPFYILGHGQILGFFAGYANEQGSNAGFIQIVEALLGAAAHLPLATLVTLEHLVALLLLIGVSLGIFLLRQRERFSLEAGTLLLFGLVFAVSPHVFPWYTTMLLPWIALLWPARGMPVARPLWTAQRLALLAPWIFSCVSITGYIIQNAFVYYGIAYIPLIIELLLAALIALYFVALPGVWRKKDASRHNDQSLAPENMLSVSHQRKR